jgi:hypothetical protein
MYTGHLAIGMAIKSVAPKTPTLPIMLGVGLMDIVDGAMIVLGFDTVTPNLDSGPYLFFDLTFVDWDHSLLMAVVISLIWAALFRKNKTTAVIAGLAVLSHFVADWPVHNDDMALYPFARQHLGFGLWGRLGTLSWVLEGIFAAVLVGLSWVRGVRRGVSLLWPSLVLVALFVLMSPWFSPLKFVATLPEPATHIAHGLIVSLGFLIPGLILTRLIDRAERRQSVPVRR